MIQIGISALFPLQRLKGVVSLAGALRVIMVVVSCISHVSIYITAY